MAWDWLKDSWDWLTDDIGGDDLISFAGAVVNSAGASSAQKQWAQSLLDQAESAQTYNYDMWKEGRGSTGHAVLPEYFGDLEKNTAQDLIDIYNSQRDNINGALEAGDQTWGDMAEAVGLGDQFIKDVYTGDLAADRQALLDKTYSDFLTASDNRVAGAQGILDDYESRQQATLQQMVQENAAASKARKAAINTSLSDRLKQVQMGRMQRGLGGSSSFDRSLSQGATIDARQAAALQDIEDRRKILGEKQRLAEVYMPARMTLANRGMDQAFDIGKGYTLDTMGGWDANRQLQQALLDAPYARAQNAYYFGLLPSQMSYSALDNLWSRLGNYYIGAGNAPSAVMPEIPFQPSTGQIIGSGLSALGEAWSANKQAASSEKMWEDYLKAIGGKG